MATFPRSAHDPTSGLIYFARMCDKIRLHAAGELPEVYQEFLGKGFDGRICGFLRIDYPALREKILAGATDEEALVWVEESSGTLEDVHRLVWNSFARKRGWQDDDGGTEKLAVFKGENGLGGREDIVTYFDFYDVDEGRRA